MSDRILSPCIYVIAGTNGAGKSSIAGAMFVQHGVEYFNPDEIAKSIQVSDPGLRPDEANAVAWSEGKRLLERAIAERSSYAFETTLGGRTIASLLETALSRGMDVRVWYVGLNSVELHLARVRARVARGGHAIPETLIRERYDRSRLNLIQLLPKLTEVRIYDNSAEADPHTDASPRLKMVLHMIRGKVIETCNLRKVPKWAKPILAAALKRK